MSLRSLAAITLVAGIFMSCNLKESLFRGFDRTDEPAESALARPVSPYPEMVYIPEGSFAMGSNLKDNEKPVHTVHVGPFYLDIYEVTVADYRRYCRAKRRKMPEQPAWNRDNHPVVNVSWNNARGYAKWAGKRLPTEAEWEYAARGLGKYDDYVGSGNALFGESYGNIADETVKREKYFYPIVDGYDDGYMYTSPVGHFMTNALGVADMRGNVLEWVADWYGASYYADSEEVDPKGPPKGRFKVIRGASYNRSGEYMRVTYRTWYHPSSKFPFLGFRCARDVEVPENLRETAAITEKDQ